MASIFISHASVDKHIASGLLDVTSRTIIRTLMEQLWMRFEPIFHRLNRASALERGLRELVVVKVNVAKQRLRKLLA